MIVISGALVLVALILLVIGLVASNLTFVYASIAVSILAFAALLIGVLQRRKEGAAVGAVDGDSAPLPSVAITDDLALAPVRRSSAAASAVGTSGGQVLVVAGRPRYHVEGCRYLAGKVSEPLEVGRAQDEGYTACGVCKPDDALVVTPASETGPEDSQAPASDGDLTTAMELPADDSTDDGADEPAAVSAAPARGRRAAAGTRTAKAVPTAATDAPAKAAKAPAKTAKAAKAPAKTAKAPAKTASTPASTAPAKKAPAKKAPAKASAQKAPAKASAQKAPAKKAPAKKAAPTAPAKKAAVKKAPAKRAR